MYRLLCLAACLITAFAPATAIDSLSAGQSISDNENLTSSEGRFILGFFTAGFNRQYLGIWYNRIPVRTVVWVANRRRPLPGGSAGSLTMSLNGSLVLADATGSVYWSTGPGPALRSPVARILNEGNLVVLGKTSNRYVWQSFDHPSDTLLSGMRIGLNRPTGERLYVSGWKSADDPAPGDFSCGLDTGGVPQLFIMNGSTPLWRGGPWVGDRFTGIPAMKASNMFIYGFNSKADGVYFQYDNWNTSLYRVTLNTSGFAEHLMWDDTSSSWALLWASANDTCERFAGCGPYGLCDVAKSPVCGCLDGFMPKQLRDWDRGSAAAGCVRKAHLNCPKGRDTFVVAAGVKLPDTSAATADVGIGYDECRARCLRNCSCTAFTSGDGSGCINWFGDLTDIRLYSSGGLDLYVRVGATTGQGDGEVWKKVIIIILVLITFFTIIISMLIYFYRSRHKSKMRRTGKVYRSPNCHSEHCNFIS